MPQMKLLMGRGHLHTFEMHVSQPITGLQLLPQFNALCVAHFKHDSIWLYSEKGKVLATLLISKMSNPSGMTAMQTIQNTVIVSDFDEKSLHVLTIRDSGGNIGLQEHKIWKLPFRPADVTTFKRDKLAILGMRTGMLHVMTEDGEYINRVSLAVSPTGNALYSAFVSKSVITSVDSGKDIVIWVDKTGKIIRSYGGEKEDHEPLDTPRHVIEDNKGRFIVADGNNHRLHLVSEDGKFVQFLLQKSDNLKKPRRLHLDTSKEKPRLFVGYGRTNNIRVTVHDYEILCHGLTNLFDEEET